jgi:4,5:9,10-diseco-3-hydroxy-5,9,17-trioxoandrosta-1(10),2-diene-4-oate hydrolase
MHYDVGRIEVDGVELRYVQAGDGPALVWLHGAGGLYLTAGTDLLAERFRLVALELPGFGSSAHHDPGSSFDELSELVAGGINGLGLRRYLLHGTSFGAATALHLALNHAERVERLVLESPAAFRPPGWTPPDVDTVRRGLFRHPERARRAQVDPERALRERALVNRFSLTVDRDALAARVRELPVPTLVIFGDADTLTPPELARMYCDNAPDCASVLIEDAAHVVSSDQPEAYARAVTEFALGTPSSA